MYFPETQPDTIQNNNKSPLTLFLVFLGFLALALWKMSPLLSQPHSFLAPGGDGHAMLGEIFDIAQRYKEHGLRALWGDVSVTDRWGDPKLYGDFAVINWFWRSLFVVFSQFFEPHKAYDSIAILGFALSGVCGYVLALRVGLNLIFSLLFSLFMVSLPNTAARLEGHLMLAFLHAPMLFLAWVIDTARRPTWQNFIFAGFGLWLAFLVNEYFGYFSIWIAGAIFISMRWQTLRQEFESELRFLLPRALAAAAFFVVLLAFSHPSIVLGPVLRRFGVVSELPPTRNFTTMSEFAIYGMKNPLLLVTPGIEIPDVYILNKLFKTSVTGEFTFRIGLLIPLFIWLSRRWLLKNCQSGYLRIKDMIMPLSIAALVAFALGLHPQFRLLVWVTSVIAPMFRVSVRAYFFLDALLLLIFFLFFQTMWSEMSRRVFSFTPSLEKYLPQSALILALLFCFRDLTTVWWPLAPFAAHALPAEVEFARKFSQLPQGLVLEVPQFSRASKVVYESLYPYKMRTAYHGMKCINFMWSKEYETETDAFAKDVNNPVPETVARLSQLGIRYVLAPSQSELAKRYGQLSGLKLVLATPQGVAFEVESPSSQRWSLNNFLEISRALGKQSN